jgi:hypothetical protein
MGFEGSASVSDNSEKQPSGRETQRVSRTRSRRMEAKSRGSDLQRKRYTLRAARNYLIVVATT